MRFRSMGLFLGAMAMVAIFVGGCGDDSSGGGASVGTDGGSAGSSADAGSVDCPARCKAVATKCSAPSNMCAEMCVSVSESQMKCVEAAPCDMKAIQSCFLSDAGTGAASDGAVGVDAANESGIDAAADAVPGT